VEAFPQINPMNGEEETTTYVFLRNTFNTYGKRLSQSHKQVLRSRCGLLCFMPYSGASVLLGYDTDGIEAR
jgi:hypothetical protein